MSNKCLSSSLFWRQGNANLSLLVKGNLAALWQRRRHGLVSQNKNARLVSFSLINPLMPISGSYHHNHVYLLTPRIRFHIASTNEFRDWLSEFAFHRNLEKIWLSVGSLFLQCASVRTSECFLECLKSLSSSTPSCMGKSQLFCVSMDFFLRGIDSMNICDLLE